jgi:hypothetical protein
MATKTTGRIEIVTLKVRTPLAQRLRAGFVFGRAWQRVDVSPEVAAVIESDDELAVSPLDPMDTEIPSATNAGKPINVGPVPEKTKTAKQTARARLQEIDDAAAAEKKLAASPASPPEGPVGNEKRGDARKS